MSRMVEYEAHTKVADGVTVTKRPGEDGFSFPTFGYRLQSDRDKPVSVRVSEPLPTDVSPTELTFHPDRGSENWHVTDGEVVFETTLGPGTACTTLWGVRSTDTAVAATVLETPFAVEVQPPLAAEATGDEVESENAAPGTADPDTTVAKPAEEVADGDHEEPAPGAHSATDDTDSPAADDETGETEAPLLRGSARRHETVSSARDGEGTGDADETAVREAEQATTARTGPAEATPSADRTSVAVQLRQLHAKVAELEAYSDALEVFLDEHGTGDQVVERLEARMDATNDTLETVESRLAAQNDELDSLFADIGEVNEQLEGLGEGVAANSEDIGSLEDDLASLRSDLPDGEFEARFQEVEAELAELRQWQSKFQQVFE